MSQTGPVIDELVASALKAPGELVTRLLSSTDVRMARLGQAIRDLQDAPPDPPDADACDGTRVIDPVTHDPAW
ncbi:hypothetical protein [Streptomyces sp. NPDC051364]|uniref:hypothetical protein n=1 Tax=Streptomyces sp. NPDC051364 TaxID=3155799 RepID=UPI0034177789